MSLLPRCSDCGGLETYPSAAKTSPIFCQCSPPEREPRCDFCNQTACDCHARLRGEPLAEVERIGPTRVAA